MIAGDPKEIFPPTSMQRSMVRASIRAPRSGVYVVQDVCQLAVELNVTRLKEAWRTVAHRHPALRTSIEVRADGELWQRVNEEPEISWCELDWTGLAPDDMQERLRVFLCDDRGRGFNFDEGVPARFTLLRTSERSHTLIWSGHHALLDGRSYLIVWKEWFDLYDGLVDATPYPKPFSAHVEWLQRRDMAAAERYWREYLAGLSQTTDYVVDRTRPVSTDHREGFAKEGLSLSEDLTHELWSFAEQHSLTVNTLIQGAWAVLLSRYSERPDVVFGVARAGRRPSAGTDHMVGVLINTLPFRIAVHPDSFLIPWLKQIRSQSLAVREHEHTPLEKVWEWSGLPPGMPPFDSVLVYDHEPPGETLRKLGNNWLGRTFSRVQRTDSPLTVAIHGRPLLTVDIVYDTQLFGSAAMAGMARHLHTLLKNFVSRPDCRLKEIGMLTSREENWLVRELNQTAAPDEVKRCAHELFQEQAQRTPLNAALEHPGGAILYSEINERANQIASLLRRRGAGPEDMIAVCLERSPEAVIAILGILKAGAAFLPLDPSLPQERLASMLLDAGVKFALGGAGPSTAQGFEVLDLGQLHDEIAREPAENLPEIATPENAAYAIYTSGSTGKPKAVVVSHGSLANHTLAASRVFGITESDRRLQFAPAGTDVFVAEVFNYLCHGATLVFGLNREGNSAGEFTRVLDDQRITITGMSSSWWNEWVAAFPDGGFAMPQSLRAVIVGMERVSPAAFMIWKRFAGNGVRWFNAYGPAEASPTATIYEAGSSEWENRFIPIGRPIANTQAYILDDEGDPVPVGVAGELYLGGAGVARGYLNAPELTARKFLPDPFSGNPNGRLYKTGDRVFYLPDGNLVFLGRADRQVKIRGFRIELEEIEAVLAQHPGVRQCAVIARSGDGRESLVAYLTPDGRRAFVLDQLRLHLARRLPACMIPAAFVVLPEMPLTASGKIDRESLAQRESQPLRPEHFIAPSTPTEERLASLWQELLGVSDVGATDDFFELGGDSLRATILVRRIHQHFGSELSLARLFRAPTISMMASALNGTAVSSCDPVISLQPNGSLIPFFCISSTADDPYCFRHLAAHLGDEQPLFAVSNPVRTGEPLQTVEGLAACVCESIRDRRPRGPYLLGGYCFGGILAFEAARQLVLSGQEVRLVALFDTPAPGYPKLLRARKRYWRHLREALFGGGSGIGFGEILSHLQVVGRLIRRKAVAGTQRTFVQAGLAPPAPSVEDVASLSERLARMYEPKPSAVPIAQFIARDQPISARIVEDPRLGWRDICTGSFQLHRVPGSHSTLLHESRAMEMAAMLSELLRAYQRLSTPVAPAPGSSGPGRFPEIWSTK